MFVVLPSEESTRGICIACLIPTVQYAAQLIWLYAQPKALHGLCLAQDAVGDRVTARLSSGQEWRLALPWRAAQPLPGLALDALAAALPPPLWQALFCRHLTSPGPLIMLSLQVLARRLHPQQPLPAKMT